MRFRRDKYADQYRKAYPQALLAIDVTVEELINYLSKLPSNMTVNSWDCYGDSISCELDINPDFDTNTVTITG